MIEEGSPAPGFELESDDGSTVSLESLRGRPVVLCSYPRDASLPPFDRMVRMTATTIPVVEP